MSFMRGLCGNETKVWNDKDFSQCFTDLVFICITHVLFAICSAYHLGNRVRQISRIRPSRRYLAVLICRIAVSLSIALVSILDIVLELLVKNKPKLEIIDYVTNSVVFVTWILHAVAIWSFRFQLINKGRGPISLILTWFLTNIGTAVQLRTVILHFKNGSTATDHHYDVKTGTILASGCLQIVYLISLLPPVKAPLSEIRLLDPASVRSINEESQEISTSPLLQTSSADSQPLGVAEDGSSCLSKMCYYWVQPLMLKGSKGHLRSYHDLFHLPRTLRTDYVSGMFIKVVNKHKKKRINRQESVPDSVQKENQSDDTEVRYYETDSKDDKDVTLLRALHKTFGLKFYSLGFLKLFSDSLTFAGPIFLNALVSFMENQTEPIAHGYYYAGGLFLSTLISSLSSVHFNYLINKLSLQARAALVTSIYQKTLSVGATTLSKFSTGEIVNFMSTDVDRVRNFGVSFHAFWSLPFQVGIAFYLLHRQIGLSFLVGIGVMVVLVPINYCLAMKIGSLNQGMMSAKDSRVKMISESLFGIRVIKFFAWERHFADKISSLRSEELKKLKGIKYLDAFCVYFWATTPILISLFTFMTYSSLGNQLTAAKVFTCVALFNILVVPLNAFPWVLNGLMEAWVSLKRLQKFHELKELDLKQYYSQDPPSDDSNHDLSINNGCFQWEWLSRDDPGITKEDSLDSRNEIQNRGSVDGDDSDDELILCHSDDSDDSALGNDNDDSQSQQPRGVLRLKNIDCQVTKGELVGVIGYVGSGKSSLLSAITAEMIKEKGCIWVDDLDQGFGLFTQDPWIQQASVKDNILFGMPYNQEKYGAVLDACALREDLKILPAGDFTEIGENGVTLSGGQKARVALARAVYQDKHIYLLDDPLAAVDAHVAAHLFTQCIMGLLANKTRILCTHHTKYLKEADRIIVMSEGRIVNSGLPEAVLRSTDLPVAMATSDSKDETPRAVNEKSLDDEEVHQEARPQDGVEENGNLIEEETKEVGVVKVHVYWSYWKAVGMCLAPSILLSLFLMQASRNVSDWWLSYWVTHSEHTNTSKNNLTVFTPVDNNYQPIVRIPASFVWSSVGYVYHQISRNGSASDTSDVSFYLTVYGSLAAANSIFTFFRAFLFAYGGICAARILHKRLLTSILKAPISFFDVTPIGRIINRFSSDMYEIDDSLPFVMNILMAQLYGLIGGIVVTCYGIPWFTLLLLPLGILYYFIQRYYRWTSRELKRISSVTLSPIYAHFSETLTGLVTIRALRASNRFQSENKDRLEINQRAQFCTMVAGQWLGIRLQMLGVAMVTGVAFIAVLEHHFQTVNPGLVGLAISYALSITSLLSGVVSMFTETEKEMVSVERTVQYIEDTPDEKDHAILQSSMSWPDSGCISFNNVYMAYRPGLPNALNGVSFSTKPGEKIGIVGRTGSGKSSLLLVLFRMVLIRSGNVVIDGVDISHISLHELRSRLVIIPQDSFLFSGTVRENLDPIGEHPDTALWSVLYRCHLTTAVQALGGLEADVAERGKHFSVGQKQLMCLARALLTNAKILCIDEATASVDQETDQLIQKAIREEFTDRTVLTIAHRINTILDSDRVLVMHDGKVAEFAPPALLLNDRNSMFYGLVNKQTK
ncbi:ATP-binding cassette sub-family C member 10-like [Ptychodera flava]|uniref:ATP-binding cassette sub-family C member 10-like n=1 Tax=Ptychodera flava TaxID=63121 RepID=UPI003969DDDB